MNYADAVKHLGVLPPFTESQLKSAFRNLVKQCHPDVKGDADTFRKVKEAFDLLLPDCGKDLVISPVKATDDGRMLSDLGKGLKVSARKCNGCQGKGYVQAFMSSNCPDCNSSIIVSWEKYFRKMYGCKTCRGTGYVGEKPVYYVCRSCSGHGEIATFNPVLIKNSITGNMSQKERKRQGLL